MRRAILVYRSPHPPHDWSKWRPVIVISEGVSTWRIWSWRNPMTRLVHKRAMGERVEER